MEYRYRSGYGFIDMVIVQTCIVQSKGSISMLMHLGSSGQLQHTAAVSHSLLPPRLKGYHFLVPPRSFDDILVPRNFSFWYDGTMNLAKAAEGFLCLPTRTVGRPVCWLEKGPERYR
jgi:hypothetical protein